MNKLPPIKEHQLQTLLMNYLQAKGWFVMRLNSGKFSVGEGSSRRYIHGQDAGTPDLLAFKHDWVGQTKMVKLVFIEVKTPKNPKPTFAQEHKMKELESKGARCLVIHSLEELEEAL